MNEPQQYIADDEIDLLDLLVTVAENIKLLVIGPLVVGFTVWGYFLAGPTSYQASFTLQGQKNVLIDGTSIELLTPAQVSQLVISPSTLKVAAKELETSGHPSLANLVHQGLAVAQVPRNTTHVQVILHSTSAAHAQTLAQALLTAILQQSQPHDSALERLQARISEDQTALNQARVFEQRLAKALADTPVPNPELLRSYGTLQSTIGSLISRINQNQARLQGLQDTDVLIAPSTTKHPTRKKQIQTIVVAVLATGFALLLFVFVRQALRNAGANPESAAKLARIRMALGFKS